MLALGLVACAVGDVVTDLDTPDALIGSETPELAVSAIVRAIGQSDDEMLEVNTLTDQLGLLALIEGASADDAMAALGFASRQIASTFWMSFSTEIRDFIESGVDGIRIGAVTQVDVPAARYATVDVAFPLDAADRVFVVTDRGGWRIDLVATFPGAFVPNIPLAVERASSPGVDPELLESIRRQSISLDALEAIGVNERTAQAIAAAREAMGVGPGG
ncbi:MAG TPA: hypothetical protein VIW46_14380, partial [Acidimicrobiia bacterium]